MEPEKKSNGALIGLIIIVIILIIGGIYMWQSNKSALQGQNPANTNQTGTTVTSQDSASLDGLDKDLQNTDTSTGVDANTVN